MVRVDQPLPGFRVQGVDGVDDVDERGGRRRGGSRGTFGELVVAAEREGDERRGAELPIEDGAVRRGDALAAARQERRHRPRLGALRLRRGGGVRSAQRADVPVSVRVSDGPVGGEPRRGGGVGVAGHDEAALGAAAERSRDGGAARRLPLLPVALFPRALVLFSPEEAFLLRGVAVVAVADLALAADEGVELVELVALVAVAKRHGGIAGFQKHRLRRAVRRARARAALVPARVRRLAANDRALEEEGREEGVSTRPGRRKKKK